MLFLDEMLFRGCLKLKEYKVSEKPGSVVIQAFLMNWL